MKPQSAQIIIEDKDKDNYDITFTFSRAIEHGITLTPSERLSLRIHSLVQADTITKGKIWPKITKLVNETIKKERPDGK